MNYNKENQIIMKYLMDWMTFDINILEVIIENLSNKYKNHKIKINTGIDFLSKNNHSVYQITGLNKEYVRALLLKYEIKNEIYLQNKDGTVLVGIHDKDFKKVQKLLVDMNHEDIDYEQIYKKFFETNGSVQAEEAYGNISNDENVQDAFRKEIFEEISKESLYKMLPVTGYLASDQKSEESQENEAIEKEISSFVNDVDVMEERNSALFISDVKINRNDQSHVKNDDVTINSHNKALSKAENIAIIYGAQNMSTSINDIDAGSNDLPVIGYVGPMPLPLTDRDEFNEYADNQKTVHNAFASNVILNGDQNISQTIKNEVKGNGKETAETIIVNDPELYNVNSHQTGEGSDYIESSKFIDSNQDHNKHDFKLECLGSQLIHEVNICKEQYLSPMQGKESLSSGKNAIEIGSNKKLEVNEAVGSIKDNDDAFIPNKHEIFESTKHERKNNPIIKDIKKSNNNFHTEDGLKNGHDMVSNGTQKQSIITSESYSTLSKNTDTDKRILIKEMTEDVYPVTETNKKNEDKQSVQGKRETNNGPMNGNNIIFSEHVKGHSIDDYYAKEKVSSYKDITSTGHENHIISAGDKVLQNKNNCISDNISTKIAYRSQDLKKIKNINKAVKLGDGKDLYVLNQPSEPQTKDVKIQMNTNSLAPYINNDMKAIREEIQDCAVLSAENDTRSLIKRDVTINRLTFNQKNASYIDVKKRAREASKSLTEGYKEGFRESAVHSGMMQYSGISQFVNSVSYKNYVESLEKISFKKYDNWMRTNQNGVIKLNSILSRKGMPPIDFSSQETGRISMENLNKFLLHKGLVTYKGEKGWDYTKFFHFNNKRNNADIIRALGLTDLDKNNPESIKELLNIINKIAQNETTLTVTRNSKRTSSKSFRNMALRKIAQDSAVLKGFDDFKNMERIIKSSVKAARMTLLLSTRAVFWAGGKMIKYGEKHYTGSKIDTELIKNSTVKTAASKTIERFKDVRIKYQNIVEKNTKEAKLKTLKEKKEKKNEVTYLRLQKMIGKKWADRVMRTVNQVSTVIKVLNPASIIGCVRIWFKKQKIKLFITIGTVSLCIFILVGALDLTNNLVATVTAFWSSDKIENSDGFKTMEMLSKAETNWTKTLKEQDTYKDFNSLRLGKDYLTPVQYANKTGLNYDSVSNGFVIKNPFGDFETTSEIAKIMNTVDGGIEVQYVNGDGSVKSISNIKDILCMAAVYFDHGDDFSEYYRSGLNYIPLTVKKSGLEAAVAQYEYNPDSSRSLDAFQRYCLELFNASHQEVIELTPMVLPTNLNYSDSETDHGENDGDQVEDSYKEIVKCPSENYGGFGCMSFDGFSYEDHKIFISDTSGALHDVSTRVQPEDILDDCSASKLEEFETAYSNNPDCYSVSTSVHYGDWHEVRRTPKMIGRGQGVLDYDEYRNVLFDTNSGFNSSLNVKVASDGIDFNINDVSISQSGGSFDVIVSIETEGNSYFTEPEGNIYYEVDEEREVVTILHFTHNCQRNHKGYYCGGHLKADVTGYVYTMTLNQQNEKSIGLVEEGEYLSIYNKKNPKHNSLTTYGLRFTNEAIPFIKYKFDDIFECDSGLIHDTESVDWEGWTEENMNLAGLKLSQDWYDLYGFEAAKTLGGKTLSKNQRTVILNQITEKYKNISKERIAVLEKALGYVGNLGYSQDHHMCPLNGPCIYTNTPCYLSDCSGFVSHIWDGRLNYIYTTRTLMNAFPTASFNGNAYPGDICIYKIADSWHAYIFVGNIEFENTIGNYFVDCNELNGIGNVFFRKLSNTDLFVIKPDI